MFLLACVTPIDLELISFSVVDKAGDTCVRVEADIRRVCTYVYVEW